MNKNAFNSQICSSFSRKPTSVWLMVTYKSGYYHYLTSCNSLIYNGIKLMTCHTIPLDAILLPILLRYYNRIQRCVITIYHGTTCSNYVVEWRINAWRNQIIASLGIIRPYHTLEVHQFSIKKMRSEMSSTKCWPFCSGPVCWCLWLCGVNWYCIMLIKFLFRTQKRHPGVFCEYFGGNRSLYNDTALHSFRAKDPPITEKRLSWNPVLIKWNTY